MATFYFEDDGSDVSSTGVQGGGDGLPWLHKAAAGKVLRAYVERLTEGTHNGDRGPRRYINAELRVMWNAIRYRTEMRWWGAKQAIPYMRAVGIQKLGADDPDCIRKPFRARFSLNEKGYLKVAEVLPDAVSHPQTPTAPPPPPQVGAPPTFGDGTPATHVPPSQLSWQIRRRKPRKRHRGLSLQMTCLSNGDTCGFCRKNVRITH